MGFLINNPQFWRTEGITEDEVEDFKIEVDENGNIKLPDVIRDELNLKNGTTLKLKFNNSKFIVKRADPNLTKVYIEPTTDCNLDCKTCVRHAWDEKIGSMKFSSYKKIIDDLQKFNSIDKISLWGIGEPLYHPDIVKMVQAAKSLDVKTQIITNGLLLDEELSRDLLKAGLDSLIVSIDGTSPETMSDIRSGAELNQIIKNMKEFNHLKNNKVKTNTEIGIDFVVMKSNVNELKDLRKLAFDLGASFIFLTNLLPYSEAMTSEILYSNSISRSKPQKRTPLRPEVYLPPTDLEENTIKSISKIMGKTSSISTEQVPFDSHGGYCKFVQEGSISINWKGEVSPCIPLMHSYNCYIRERKKYIKEYYLGNTNNKSIYDIWNSEEFKNFRKEVIEFPFSECTQCSGCNLSKTNEEDCHGNEFPVCGDCLWAKGVIQCP